MQIEHPFWVRVEPERKDVSSLPTMQSSCVGSGGPRHRGRDNDDSDVLPWTVRCGQRRRAPLVHPRGGVGPQGSGRTLPHARLRAWQWSGGWLRGGGPKLPNAVTREAPLCACSCAQANLAHTLFLDELDRSGSLFSGKLVGQKEGGRCMQRGEVGDEWASERMVTSRGAPPLPFGC